MRGDFASLRYGSVEKQIGVGEPAFLVAELGANHDKDLQQALRMVDLVAEAGFDAVKLQTYTADSLTLPDNSGSTRLDPIWGADSLYSLYANAAMPLEFHEPLFDRIHANGMLPFTTVYDPMDLGFAESLDCPVYKVSSFELNHFELLEALAATRKPLIVSTGAADFGEVAETMDFLQGHGSGPVLLMQCSSSYPAPPAAANLRAIESLSEAFGVPVGFSDHTEGFSVTLAAVALGARAIEKHFTDDPGRPGPDHRFSLGFRSACEMVSAIRDVEEALGDGIKKIEAAEYENREVGKRSIYVARDISAGELLADGALRVVRPGDGAHPRHLGRARASRARRDIVAGSPLRLEDID